jgi:hypothetical protein
MLSGICHNYIEQFGVLINIPESYRDTILTLLDNGDIDKYTSNPFQPQRIIINFVLRDPRKEDPNSKVCIPVSIMAFIRQTDLLPGWVFNDLNLADWDGIKWNILTWNLERWTFSAPIVLNGVQYIGYIKADACISGDPPIAVGK